MTTQSLNSLEQTQDFIRRHIGPSESQTQAMLNDIGAKSVDALIDEIVPSDIRLSQLPNIGESKTEVQALADLKAIASLNKVNDSYIGLGYYGTLTPNVILRNVLENPGWYTAYTPYQPEIAQGRLQSLLNFQQMCLDLTGLDLASASLLDEGTAAAEAMALAKRVSKNKKSNLFFISDDVFPQTIDVVKQRAEMFGFDIVVAPAKAAADHDIFGALIQYPGASGEVTDVSELIEQIHAKKAIVAVAADIMSLVLLKSPGELGADAVIGSTQRFGVPMGYGVHTRHSLLLLISTNVHFQVVLLVFQKILAITQHYVWLCKRVNNIFAVKKLTQIFVQPKYYLPIWPLFTRYTTVLKA